MSDFVAFHANGFRRNDEVDSTELTQLTLQSSGKAFLINDNYKNDDRSDAMFAGSRSKFEGTWEEKDGKVHVSFTTKATQPYTSYPPEFKSEACIARLVVEKTGLTAKVVHEDGVQCVFKDLDNQSGHEERSFW